MKNKAKLLVLLLALTLSLSLFACGGGSDGCDECVDADGDGICDVCENEINDNGDEDDEEPASDIALIEDGVPNFQVIFGDDISADVRKAVNQNIVAKLRVSHDIEVDAVSQGGDNDVPQDVEILIGNVDSRGAKYVFDRYALGKEGYMIKIIGSKIVIHAGSDEQLVEVISEFADEIMKIGTDDVDNATMKVSDVVYKVQDDYKIKSVTVGSTDMRGYTIATDTENDAYMTAALSVQDALYDKSGYWLKIVPLADATDKSVIIKSAAIVYGDESYSVKADGTKLIISCSFENRLEAATDEFVSRFITLARGESIEFKGNVFNKDISVLYYEDFGAKGDGETDDFLAFYETHKTANECGQKVVGNPDAKYYLCNSNFIASGEKKATVHTIEIQTPVDWNGATIIIDDRKMHNYSSGNAAYGADKLYYTMAHTVVFSVTPNDEHKMFEFKDKTVLDKIVKDGLNPSTTKIDFKVEGWDGDLMIIPYNTAHGVYKRRGYGQYNGADMHELIIIDKDGNVSAETPIMFDYQNIDYIQVYKLDESTAITIENAKVITRDSQIDHTDDKDNFQGGYVTRGLSVRRSYTTVKNLEHVVTDGFSLYERAYHGLEGPSANGFFVASNANRVIFKDCIMPGRMKYSNSSSYNFSANTVNKIVLDGCVQSNFWVTVDEDGNMTPSTEWTPGAKTSMGSVTMNGKSIGLYWGLGGTNWCKNMEYLNSKISRFDAHQGLYDGKIINTEINDMELTGVGTLEIENVKWYSYGSSTPLLFLRSDYGYTWEGDITLKNVEAYIHRNQNLVISNHSYVNWYFGYTSALPNVSIDNLDILYMDNQTPVAPGYEVTTVKVTNQRMHLLEEIGATVTLPYCDKDGNGKIDEPLFDNNRDGIVNSLDDIDLDGDGDKFNTSLDYISEKDYIADGGDQKDYRRGTSLSGCTYNTNLVKPPEYFKVINNDGVDGKGGYVYVVANTAGQGISDGLWYTTEDTYGGFFGGTKFIYGEGKNEFFLGTGHGNQSGTTPFYFK